MSSHGDHGFTETGARRGAPTASRPGLPPLPAVGPQGLTSPPSPRPGSTKALGGAGNAPTTEEQLRAALIAGHLVEPTPERRQLGLGGVVGARRGGGGSRASSRASSRDLTPRRIGPRLPGEFVGVVGAADDASVSVFSGAAVCAPALKALREEAVNGETQLFYLSEQIACARWGGQQVFAGMRQSQAAQAGASVWAKPQETGGKSCYGREELARLVRAGADVARWMLQKHTGRHMAVVSAQELATQVDWQGAVEVSEINESEPPPLATSEQRVRAIVRYLSESPDNVVVFLQPDILLLPCVLAVHAGVDLDSAFVKVCELVWCTAALAGSARYLAALYDICQLPAGLVMKQTQAVTIGSVRIYGDLEFVASTESLIKVHMELHHSTYIDSTDFREQMLYRVTRAQDSDACIVLHFLPVELIHDVRILVFSTLAGEMGLITGPQPMFQLQFHTAFVEGASKGRPFVFYKEDLDLLQSKCPVSRVEFVPGARNDDALAAPEVKFVRKKVKRSSTSPLGVIADLISHASGEAPASRDDEERTLESGRPIERRRIGKVYYNPDPKAGAIASGGGGGGRGGGGGGSSLLAA